MTTDAVDAGEQSADEAVQAQTVRDVVAKPEELDDESAREATSLLDSLITQQDAGSADDAGEKVAAPDDFVLSVASGLVDILRSFRVTGNTTGGSGAGGSASPPQIVPVSAEAKDGTKQAVNVTRKLTKRLLPGMVKGQAPEVVTSGSGDDAMTLSAAKYDMSGTQSMEALPVSRPPSVALSMTHRVLTLSQCPCLQKTYDFAPSPMARGLHLLRVTSSAWSFIRRTRTRPWILRVAAPTRTAL